MSFLEVILLALVEGLTEFLPVSSTGHLILMARYLELQENQFVTNFNIIIQFGAILAVIFEYRERFFNNSKIYKTLLFGFIPTAVIGLLVGKHIDQLLNSVTVVAIALILGGIVLIFIDDWFSKKSSKKIEQLKPLNAVWIGVIQCLAFIPGVSRAAATIIGGRLQGLSKVEATEFSFLLAVPTITAAACYKGIKVAATIQAEQIVSLVIGTIMSFIFALIAIRFFIQIVSRFGLKYFGYYRIILGAIVLLVS
jgi:undecaprenyl-diphosphatase